MAELKEVYKCEICGNIVEILHAGGGRLVCCGEDMHLQDINVFDEAGEKHMPILAKGEGTVIVGIGQIEHPMTEDHYIEWIEVHTKDNLLRHVLKVGDKPKAEFDVNYDDVVMVRSYCNIHGMWQLNI